MRPTNITLQRRTLGGLLRLVEGVAREKVYAGLAERGYTDIRPAHSALLRNLNAEGARVSELAERAQITKQSMGYLADTLATAGYVTLEADPSDGRAKLVRLTAKGQAAMGVMIKISAEVEVEFAGLIGEENMAHLRRLLDQLAARLS